MIDISENSLKKLVEDIKKSKQVIYYLETKEDETLNSIIGKKIGSITVIIDNKVYYINREDYIKTYLGDIFEDMEIQKIGYKLKQDYILLKQIGIELKNFYYDIEIAGYIIDSIKNKYDIETMSLRYLNLELSKFAKAPANTSKQLDLFGSMDDEGDLEQEKNKACIYVYAISKLYGVTRKNNKRAKLYKSI